MPPPIFPTRLFGFSSKEMDIERQTLKGGTALSGEQDVTSTDGGGRVFAEFSGGGLVDRPTILAWRAILTALEEGVTRVVVMFCEARFTPYGGGHSVPHSDGSPFDDETLYSGGGPTAEADAPAALRAVSLRINTTFARPLIGGEWFAIEHPTKGWRAYRIMGITDQTDDAATVTFRPPLREAVTAGEAIEFRAPRCLMVQDGRASTKTDYARYTEAAIRFVEAP